ncbi:efflux RND transporter periplasmic adaptor subunit [Roseibacillus ishigakijimensis]|uniref:Efflux RND transporter periplasmic adaptor subunit n=1 Tax=Roseibacillus ishigakijimensis TaxID=454146 RepID=A0A934RSD9_9BACT|nr:efflux RND transporter periplasmic adaptor subunit [Roseibacillus ishigakijimensis]MBK1834159.1 efflux RND transporter periplasmic adaptor subunit [Roseibacillus ishigakijimensis]
MKNENDLADIMASAQRSHSRGRWFTLLVLLLLAAGVILWLRQREERNDLDPTFATESIRRGAVALTITTTGTLEPLNEVTIGSEISGTVAEVYVDINDEVTKGQPLAKLDTTKLAQQTEISRASLRAANASVSQAQASLQEARANLARLQKLHEVSAGRSPSQADLDAAQATVARAQADLEAAQAQVAQAQANLISNESDLKKGVLHSPVDGVVLTRSIEVGQTVAAQFQAPELFVIAEDLSTMNLVVAVAEADIGRVATRQRATFTVDAWPKRTFSAEVEKVSFGSEVTDNVVTYETELSVTNEDLSLRPGMTATATIAVAEAEDVLLVPNTALRFDPSQTAPAGEGAEPKKSLVQSLTPGPPRRGNGSGRRPPGEEPAPGSAKPDRVWVLRDGRPVPILVETGLSDGRHTGITAPDLHAGEAVIISSYSPNQS